MSKTIKYLGFSSRNQSITSCHNILEKLNSGLLLPHLDEDDGIDLGVIPVALDELHSDLASTDLTLFALE